MESKEPNYSSEVLQDVIRERLAPSGLKPLGWFEADGAAALLIGNIGSSIWPVFSVSDEYFDGQPDPLNRWTAARITKLKNELPAGTVTEVRFPFGEPIWPFQQYAKKAMGVEQSPLGLLIHPEFGLWFAFRAVLIFAGHVVAPMPRSTILDHPCDSCIDKPCLHTCPIEAFTAEAYDYPRCKSYVGSQAGRTCFTGGCLARKACPVGQSHVNDPAHQAFHMRAMVNS